MNWRKLFWVYDYVATQSQETRPLMKQTPKGAAPLGCNRGRTLLPSDHLDGMSVLWLATQSQVSLRLIQVSVKRERMTYGLPLFVPVSR